jgi:hypothetical protein
MIIFAVYLCIAAWIMIKICQTFTIVTLFKIKNTYNTRNSSKLHVSYKRTNYRVHTVFNKGISIWNCPDEEIKNKKSYFSSKKKA